ncbi:tetratricopeptide repeat protein [Actinoplanes sp. NPDC023714]|uniref:tetratricopeptide repeat protein n=1 Tax=Actinoplanes sp. NPDC023714 TaxID=3154322 RepID=UPI0033D90C98
MAIVPPLTQALERARLLVTDGDPDAARRLLEHATEQAKAELGADHPQVLTTQVHLASLHHHAGDAAAARRILEEAYATGQRRHGDAHPVILRISLDLGTIAEELGNHHEARKAFTRVTRHGPAAIGAEHQAVARARAYLSQDPDFVRRPPEPTVETPESDGPPPLAKPGLDPRPPEKPRRPAPPKAPDADPLSVLEPYPPEPEPDGDTENPAWLEALKVLEPGPEQVKSLRATTPLKPPLQLTTQVEEEAQAQEEEPEDEEPREESKAENKPAPPPPVRIRRPPEVTQAWNQGMEDLHLPPLTAPEKPAPAPEPKHEDKEPEQPDLPAWNDGMEDLEWAAAWEAATTYLTPKSEPEPEPEKPKRRNQPRPPKPRPEDPFWWSKTVGESDRPTTPGRRPATERAPVRYDRQETLLMASRMLDSYPSIRPPEKGRNLTLILVVIATMAALAAIGTLVYVLADRAETANSSSWQPSPR